MTKKIFLSALAVAVSLSFASIGSADAKMMKPMTKSQKMMMMKKKMMMKKHMTMKKPMAKKAM